MQIEFARTMVDAKGTRFARSGKGPAPLFASLHGYPVICTVISCETPFESIHEICIGTSPHALGGPINIILAGHRNECLPQVAVASGAMPLELLRIMRNYLTLSRALASH